MLSLLTTLCSGQRGLFLKSIVLFKQRPLHCPTSCKCFVFTYTVRSWFDYITEILQRRANQIKLRSWNKFNQTIQSNLSKLDANFPEKKGARKRVWEGAELGARAQKWMEKGSSSSRRSRRSPSNHITTTAWNLRLALISF